MNMKLKRSIAMLLLVCSLISLLGIGAFATGGESTPETTPQDEGQTTSTLTLSPTFVPPADSAATDSPATGTGTTYTITFYSFATAGDTKLVDVTRATGQKLAETDLPTTALPDGVVNWYVIKEGDTTGVLKTTADMCTYVSATDANFSVYPAYTVSYYYTAEGSETRQLIGTESVKDGGKPASAPTSFTTADGKKMNITGWLDKNDTTVDFTATTLTITSDTSYYAVAEAATDPGDDAPTGDPIKLTFYDYDGTELAEIDYESGKAITADKVPASAFLKGTTPSCWLLRYADAKDAVEVYDITSVKPTATASLTAAWQVSYKASDGSELGKELVITNGTPLNAPTTDGTSGNPIAGWMNEKNIAVELSEQVVTSNITFTAWVRPTLVMDKSVAYVKGNADKNGNVYRFLPDGKLTRAEAAKMLYELLSDGAKTANGPIDVTFSDVALPDAAKSPWYSKSIYTMASYGLLNGTGNNKFEPTREITRAEFINMVARIYGINTSTTTCPFTDVTSSKWYYSAVMTAYDNRWITGYAQENGTYTFEPQRMITRAEAVSILNRVIGRTPTETDKARIDAYDWRIFIDVDTNWAYYEIMQAATGCGNNIPNTGLSEGRHTFKLNGADTYFFVNADKRFIAVKAGLNKMSDGKSYYFRRDGAGATIYSAGLRIISNKMYLFAGDGTAITEPRSGYDTRVYEYKGHMYYINKDGSLLRNGYFGQLYFGSNGAYTSGDKVLDTWINNFIDDHPDITDADTQEDMLYEAYVALRDFPKERYGYGSAGYWRYDLRTYTDQEHASLFYERAKGSCEEWAYAMVYLARRIGYKAAGASGKLGGQNNAIHVWEVIEIDDKLYAFDVEQEWGFMYRYYNSKLRTDRDCWKMEYAPDKSIKYGTRFAGTTYGSSYAGYRNVWSPYVYNRSSESLGF